ncbi:MAG: hypothetical protein AYK18_17135 [Theionarchaea archaeon DG-70]|nr:MAG: hypothetical protein AYK18_17135 [Theionarchaea archaeon DG-70]
MNISKFFFNFQAFLVVFYCLIPSNKEISEYQTLIGQIGRIFSREAQQEYRMFILMKMTGAIVAVIGFGVTVVGVVTSKKQNIHKSLFI